ncbi:MAG: transcription termination factor Rho [Luteolibacter sp.]|jgi:transcription termination factor Rho|nr:transcription termination factor Rho [Luteolibacter sp.]
MSKHTNEETPQQNPMAADDAAPPARKRAAKKAVAKKAVAKKAAARKVAKKSAETPDFPEMTAARAPAAAAPPKKAARAKKSDETPAAAAEPVRQETPPQPFAEPQEARRFGRVPGGGPLVPRETSGEAPAAEPPPPPAAREFRERPPQDGPARNFQNREPQGRDGQQERDGQPRESRSKRRREKRKRRGERPPQHQHQPPPQPPHRSAQGGDFQAGERSQVPSGPKMETDGMLELAPKGFGFLRIPGRNFEQVREDVFVTPETIRKFNLRLGQWIHGVYQSGPRGPQLVEVSAVNGMPPEEASKLPHFDELKAINPTRRISFETTPERFTTRVVDIMSPVGRGQRGLIVSPPRSGKTTLLLHMAEAIREKYDEAIHLMVLLVDERPEEVTEFRRALPGAEIYASSNDEQARNHCRIAELAIERAKRLVEAGKDVFLLMDSITRLARAYNNTMGNRGRGTGSGGITIGALEVPRRLFAAARNTRGGGSLTIMATALIQTNSRADEAIFMEFKGTGNMELVLDRKIAENYIYPAVDIFKSGTRREELLIPDHMLHKIHLIRRGLSGHRPVEAMERLLFFLKKFSNNPQMLLEIKG